MRITTLIHSLDGGGAERVMAGLVSSLAERGHHVVLVTLDEAESDRHTVDPGVDRVALGVMRASHSAGARLFNTARRLRAIRRAVIDSRPAVVLSFCDQTNVSVLMALVGTPLPVVVAERSDPAQQHLGRLWETARRWSYRRAARVIALTETAANHLRGLGCPAVDVIPSAIERPPVFSDRETAASRRRMIAVGRLAHEKGFDRLIDAFATATTSASDWTLEILGEGPQRAALERQVLQQGLSDRVTIRGWVRPVWPELSASTLFVLASRYEGFPSALLEAMAVGVPALAVDCESGPRAIVEHGETGYLVDNTTASLAEGMRRMMNDAELRERLGKGGRNVLSRFGWDAMVDAYERVLVDVHDASPSAAEPFARAQRGKA